LFVTDNLERLRYYRNVLEETYYQNKAQILAEIETLDQGIAKCIKDKDEKFNDYNDGRISPEVYNECFKRLDSKERDWVDERTNLAMSLKYDFKKQVSDSLPIIENIAHYFKTGDCDIKVRLLNAILDGKMIFCNGDYQTLNYNPAIKLLLNIDKGLLEKEKGQISKSAPFASRLPLLDLNQRPSD
jgi:hypothetical protein